MAYVLTLLCTTNCQRQSNFPYADTIGKQKSSLKNVAQGWKNGPLNISSRDNLWYAKNRDISLRF